MTERTINPQRSLVLRAAVIMLSILLLLIGIELIDGTMQHRLDAEGIEPREAQGLVGIIFSPFLHADWGHLYSNMGPGVVLGFLILLAQRFMAVTAFAWIISGITVWILAPSHSVTIGASGVVFGWLTYLLVRGVLNRSAKQIAIGVIVFLVYGSILFGVLPSATGESVSWQGHLGGALAGILAAMYLARQDRVTNRRGRVNPRAAGTVEGTL